MTIGVHWGKSMCQAGAVGLVAAFLCHFTVGQSGAYPHNAVSCERCHFVPTKLGTSTMTVERLGAPVQGQILPAPEGGIHHRNGESAQNSVSANQIVGARVSLNPLGDGYIEAIDSHDIERNIEKQSQAKLGIGGAIVTAPVLEAAEPAAKFKAAPFQFRNPFG
jgi:hypothetical protein